MALDFKVGTYNITSAESPLVITKSEAQAFSLRLSTDVSAGTITGNGSLGVLSSTPIDLAFGTPISIGKGLGFDEVTINITAGSAQLMII